MPAPLLAAASQTVFGSAGSEVSSQADGRTVHPIFHYESDIGCDCKAEGRRCGSFGLPDLPAQSVESVIQVLKASKRSTDFLIFKAQIINLRILVRSGGIGRHAILRGRVSVARASSSPAFGTIFTKSYSITVVGLIAKYMGYLFESLLRLRTSLRLNRFEKSGIAP